MNLPRSTYEQLNFGDGSYINISTADNTDVFHAHWHTEAEIILILEGSYLVTINGIPYHLHAKDILFIAPGELHEMTEQSEGSHMVMQYNYSLINNLNDFRLYIAILQSVKYISAETAPDIHSEIFELLLQIKDEHASKADFGNALTYSCLLRIYVLLARKYTKLTSRFPDITLNKNQEYILKFSQIFTYINNNYTEDIGLEEISSLAGFSKFHFSRLFKQFTNMSLNDYINHKRISEAEVLLTNPNLSITEVSLQSGFNCLSTFNRVFKSVKDCTPSEFKELYNSHHSK